MGLAPVPVYAQERKEKTLAKVLAFFFGMTKVKPQELKDTLTSAKSRAAHESTLRQMACTLTIRFMFTTLSFWFIGNVVVRFLRWFEVYVLLFQTHYCSTKPWNTGSPSSL